MHITLRKRVSFYLTCACTGIIILLLIGNNTQTAEVFNYVDNRTLVIDPGHGGHDGGALGIDGTKESGLNLEIAMRLNDISALFGIRTVMTRIDDTPLTDLSSYSEHQDLVRRTETANSELNAVLISIHQNTFPTPLPSGVEVLYADTADSKRLGELIQKNIISAIDNDNRRVAQPAPPKLYITANVQCPAVLIECGFISNADDLGKLKNAEYQLSFAMLTAGSYIQYLCGSTY